MYVGMCVGMCVDMCVDMCLGMVRRHGFARPQARRKSPARRRSSSDMFRGFADANNDGHTTRSEVDMHMYRPSPTAFLVRVQRRAGTHFHRLDESFSDGAQGARNGSLCVFFINISEHADGERRGPVPI